MEETHEEYKKRAVKNIFVLIFRSGFLQLINFVGGFILTILLEPKIFGLFAVVSAIINFLNYFSDIGLAASLVQKKDKVEDEELRSIFTVQQLLVISLCILAVILSPLVKKLYNLDASGQFLYFALLSSFFFSSLKTIPSVLLERELQFEKLIIPQVVEALFFNITAVVLASRGFGALAFAWAVFLRGFSGLVVLYIIKPWRIGYNLSFLKYKHHFKFGLPFQLNSLLAMLKDDMLVVFLGKILSFTELGLIGWGQKWAFMPLRFILDNVAKISFSAFSRIQEDEKKLEKAVNKAIFGTSFITFPILIAINVAAGFAVDVIPKYHKWAPALPFLFYFSLNAAMACIFITLVNFFNSKGKVKLTLYLMVFWTSLSWILNLVLIYFLGAKGVGIASVIMGLASLVTLKFAKDMIKIDYGSFLYPGLAAFLTIIAVLLTMPDVPRNYLSMFVFTASTLVFYLLTSLLIYKNRLFDEIKFLKRNLK